MCAWPLSQVQLFCEPMDCSPLGSSVHRIFQGRIWEWVAIITETEIRITEDKVTC